MGWNSCSDRFISSRSTDTGKKCTLTNGIINARKDRPIHQTIAIKILVRGINPRRNGEGPEKSEERPQLMFNDQGMFFTPPRGPKNDRQL